MFFGNSRVVIGNNYADPAVGGWFAVSPNPDEYSVSGNTYGFDDDVTAIEKMGSLFFFAGKFVKAHDGGGGDINCWRVGFFDGINYGSITYSGNAAQGLTHTTTSLITEDKLAAYTLSPVLDSLGDKNHLLVGGVFNRVGHKTVHSMAKIVPGPFFEDTVVVDNNSFANSLVRSISPPFTTLEVNPNNGPSLAYPADSYNIICGNGLTEGAGPAGGKILLYKFDNGSETIVTDVGGVHPFSNIQLSSGTTGSNAQFQGCFAENDTSDNDKVKIYFNSRQTTTSPLGSYFQIYNMYSQTWERELRDSSTNSSCLSNPWVDPNATSAFRGKKSVNNNFTFFKGEVHRIRGSRLVYDENQTDFLGSLSLSLGTCGVGSLPTKSIICISNVYYNQADQLIVAGGFPDKIIIWDGKIAKDMQFPASINDDGSTYICSVFVDTDRTIYVGGNFEFTDSNGAIAKNLAKFVPPASKL